MSEPTPEPIVVSLVAQLAPLNGKTPGGLDLYCKQLTGYLARNLEQFADAHGGDVFLTVIVAQADATANREYRSGHFVHPDEEGEEDPRGYE